MEKKLPVNTNLFSAGGIQNAYAFMEMDTLLSISLDTPKTGDISAVLEPKSE